jgi:uncharacterized protein (DUF1778 family)
MRANLIMRDSSQRAALTATLLNPRSAGPRVDRSLLNQCKGYVACAASRDERPERTAAPLFWGKGAASADGFDPLSDSQPPIASAVGAAPSSAPRVRVWLRLDAARRAKLKHAAAIRKLTCQAILASAVESFLAECVAVPGAAAMAFAMISNAPAPQAANRQRHKLAIWVQPEKRDDIRATAARLGQSIQAFLQAAIDEALERMTRNEGASREVLAPEAEDLNGVARLPVGEISRRVERATRLSAEIISFRRATRPPWP